MEKQKVILHFTDNVFFVVDVDSRKVIKSENSFSLNVEQVGKFIEQQQSDGYHIKAVVFSNSDLTTVASRLAYNFRKELFSQCHQRDIFCFFSSKSFASYIGALKAFGNGIELNENVLIFDVNSNGDCAMGFIFRRERDCFRLICGYPCDFLNMREWKNGIIQKHQIERFIVQTDKKFINHQNVQQTILWLGPGCFTFVFSDVTTLCNNAVFDKVLHILGEQINQFDVFFPLHGSFRIYDGPHLICLTSALDKLPFEKTFIIENSPTKTVTLYFDCYSSTKENLSLMETIQLHNFKTKQSKIVFKLDLNSFYDLKVESVEDKSVCLFEELAENSPEKFKMIFGKSEYSVHLILDGKERVLEDGDGLSKTPIFIAFKEDPPIIGQKARKVFEEAPEYVVFDLIKICSTKSGDIFSSKWAFSVCQKSKDIVVSVKTSTDGQTVEYTVSALLALILKEAGDRVEKVVGKSLKKVDVGFDGFKAGEILKKNFEEAGKIAGFDIAFV